MTLKQKAFAVISVLNNETNIYTRRGKLVSLSLEWHMTGQELNDLVHVIEVARDTAKKWDKWE